VPGHGEAARGWKPHKLLSAHPSEAALKGGKYFSSGPGGKIETESASDSGPRENVYKGSGGLAKVTLSFGGRRAKKKNDPNRDVASEKQLGVTTASLKAISIMVEQLVKLERKPEKMSNRTWGACQKKRSAKRGKKFNAGELAGGD